ncbi:MAG: hypothetical protein RLN96_05005 [Pseudomonadales bacterium]
MASAILYAPWFEKIAESRKFYEEYCNSGSVSLRKAPNNALGRVGTHVATYLSKARHKPEQRN